jgi:peroxiredoxin Q/BCP
MSRWWWLLLVIPLLGGLGYSLFTARTHLRVGDVAPDFSLPGSDGQMHSLAALRGKTVVLAWYPRAFTPGCTSECTSLSKGGAMLKERGVIFFAASTDSAEKNRDFAESVSANYPILSDPDGKVAKSYGVLTPLGFSDRTTFIIDPEGRLKHIITSVETTDHANQIAQFIKLL